MKINRNFRKSVWLVAIVVFSIGFFTLQSCESEEETVETEQILTADQKINSTTDRASLEWIGVKHNEMLDLAMEIKSFPEFDRQELYDLYDEDFSTSGLETFSYEQTDALLDEVYSYTDLADLAQQYNANGMLSNNGLNAMLALNEILMSNEDQNQLIADLNSFEANAAATYGLSGKELNTILSTSIVIRYSSAYWDNVFNDPSNPWNERTGFQRKWWKKLLRIAADAAGLFVGDVIAGPVGGVFLGGAASSAID